MHFDFTEDQQDIKRTAREVLVPMERPVAAT